MTTKHKPNRLANEKSPYLLQHAYNPVDWFPWSDEAFEKAKRENKPIFLSIGYSTCHWCHVMEHESFEDEEVAALLNEHFISIKVDREERPDVDHIYMTVCQAMTGHGGWPLTVVMTPEKKPFFAGTYFPKETKWGRTGLMDILRTLSAIWTQDRARIENRVDHIHRTLAPHMSRTDKGTIHPEMLTQAYQHYVRLFDPEYGGFGDAPKFPTPHNLLFLLRHWHLTGEQHALAMVEKTLDSMHRGGIYDHIGYGFARYSVDREWLVPHFEKMLYDNALLAYTYLEAFQATGNSRYAAVAREIFTYVLRDMTDPEGGFYSAEDADSEGEEGKFYVWTPEEIREVLGEEVGELFCQAYDITPQGNFEGHSIPNLINTPLERFAARIGKEPEQVRALLQGAREKLFHHREKRIHPGKDDKILTAWNGLMIAALAKGGRVLGEPAYTEAARRAVQFVMNKLRNPDGRLLARYRDGEAAYLGYVDDYAFLIWGLTELYDTTYEEPYLRQALELNDDLLRLFWDEQDGGLFFYGSDGERLIARPKEIYDGATPSGNGVSAYNFLRLYQLTGRTDLREKAEQLLEAFAGGIRHYPPGYSFSLQAIQLASSPVRQVVVAGPRDDERTQAFLAQVTNGYQPFTFVLLHEPDSPLPEVSDIARDKGMREGMPTVYVCENFACQAPVTDLEGLAEMLR
ncbi:thioredoxin domain-containing protein [Brevibacillus sp. SYP-B805]|uniref:thioredoxin domain-containing protein n=1 Tax=Brevibacillus sp. SYP-B805 TaxID=1578199 RepID=UPI0013EDAA8B|nr:thioredoxin domain-containing protein [Brevibacillus sp. SYP-B805]NGQ95741.1 thioredoxin domain-containing protein [Brevibacillus sp. SYP-B805]